MNAEERSHTERLLEINRTRMHELEVKVARYGELETPAHIAIELRELRATVGALEGQLRTALPRHNLPPRDYERFVGRQQELAELRRLLAPRSRAFVVTIDGIGGIGKSALALEAAYSYRDEFAQLPKAEQFEAIVWVSAKRSYLTAGGILERRQAFRTLDDLHIAIAHVLDYPAITRARAEERHALVEQALGEQRTLLIIDNLETVDDEDLLVFLRELPNPTKALVTTRHRVDVAYPVRLTGMPHMDAMLLINQEAERKNVALTSDDVEALWQRTGGMPLALVWSIGLMGLGGSVESVLRRLSSGQSDIARFCFEESARQIQGRDAHKLLMALSLFAKDADRNILGVVAGLQDDWFGRDAGLEDLLRLSLVNKDANRYSLLPLTRTFVQVASSIERPSTMEAQQRMYDYYLELSNRGDDWFFDWEGQTGIERDLPNVIAVIEEVQAKLIYKENIEDQARLLDPSSVPLAYQLVQYLWIISRTCRIRGYWSECEHLCEMAIEICEYLKDYSRVGWRYHDLSRISYYRGDLVLAKQRAYKARSAWLQKEDGNYTYHADRVLGLIALREGNLTEARQLLVQAMDTYQSMRSDDAPPYFASAFGMLTEREGKPDEANSWYQQSISFNRQKNDLPNLAFDLMNFGRVQQNIRQLDLAEEQYNESLKIAHECGRADVIARVLYYLATLELERGHQQGAIEYAHQALDLFRRVGMNVERVELETTFKGLIKPS